MPISPLTFRPQPPRSPESLLGVYLTDGRKLVRTVDLADGTLIGEDCAIPASRAPRVVTIDRNVAPRWRTVRGGIPVAQLLPWPPPADVKL